MLKHCANLSHVGTIGGRDFYKAWLACINICAPL